MGHERAPSLDTRKRNEKLGIPGIRPITIIPTELMAGNIAFDVVDKENFASMQGKNFKPFLYYSDQVQVIRVTDKDPRSKTGFYYMLYDGHHRVKGAESYQRYLKQLKNDRKPPPAEYLEYLEMLRERGEDLPKNEYDYDVFANDITDSLIEKPGQHFTPAQAIALVIKPTRQHQDIAAHRIAAHVLTDWDRIFRTERERDYSALAALCYLGINELHDKPSRDVTKYLNRQDIELISDETDERRTAITQALGDLSEIVRQTTRGYDVVTLNAFQTVVSLQDSEENSALKKAQTDGLLALPEIQRKITADTQSSSEVTERYEQTQTLLFQALPQAAQDFRENRTFRQAILDPNLTYDDLVDFLQPPPEDYTPAPQEDRRLLSTRYTLVKYKINLRQALELYQSSNDGMLPPTNEFEKIKLLCERDTVANKEQLKEILTTAKESPAQDQPETRREKPTRRPRNGETTARVGHQGNPKEEFLIFLDSGTASTDDSDLREVYSRLRTLFRVNWDAVPFDLSNDGKGRWFVDKMKFRDGQSLSDENRHRVTLLIDNIMKSSLSEMEMTWDTLSYSVRDREGNTGLDAIDNSLSNRLARVAYDIGFWDRSTPDFRFLATNHYALSLNARLLTLRAKDKRGANSQSDNKQLKFYEWLHKKIDAKLGQMKWNEYELRNDNHLYPELLQYVLYADPESTTRQKAISYIRDKNSNRDTAGALLQAFKEETGFATVDDLFRGTFLE